jgi:hypothetical protein
MRTVGFFGLRPGRYRHSGYLAGRDYTYLDLEENINVATIHKRCFRKSTFNLTTKQYFSIKVGVGNYCHLRPHKV